MAAPASDITGYRNDGGALGQDQGLSKNLRGILTAKAPLLSAPGTVLENTLYYDINTSSVTAVEMQATFAKDRITFNNFTYQANPSAYIPSVLFAGTVFWVVELPDITLPSNAGNIDDGAWDICAPHGWGFSALDNILVYMGASTIAQIQIDWITNFLIACACCETFSKRGSMIQGAGLYLNWRDKSSVLAPPTQGNNFWVREYYGGYYTTAAETPSNSAQINDAFDSTMKTAIVPIRLPFSSMAVLDKRLSLDTKLSTQPIQITLQTKGLEQFMSVGNQLKPYFGNQYKSSSLQLWQEELSDKSLSVRNELLAMPEFNVGYPFQYAQSIPFTINSQTDSGTTSFVFTMNITSIINSDLTSFLFNVTWNGRTEPAAGQLCPLYGEKLQDIELLLNGQRFFYFDQNIYQFATLAKQIDNPNAPVIMPAINTSSRIDWNTYGKRGKSEIVESNIYEFNNSRLRAIVAEDNLQNTARFTNQTFQLRFKINRDAYYLPNYTGTTEGDQPGRKMSAGYVRNSGYQLNMTYLYNAVFLIGGDGGTTKLITN